MKINPALKQNLSENAREDQSRILLSLDRKLNSKYSEILVADHDLDPKEKAKAQWRNRQAFKEIAELEKTKQNFQKTTDNTIELMQEFEELKEDILDPETEETDC